MLITDALSKQAVNILPLENLARMKTGMQEAAAEHDRERDGRAELLRQMDPKDQERILKEVLKEFLNS